MRAWPLFATYCFVGLPATYSGPSVAGCNANDGIVVCTGNLGTGVSAQQGYTSLTVSSLTALIAPQAFGAYGVALGMQAQAGRNDQQGNGAISLALTFAGSPFGVTSPNGGGIVVNSFGGNGGNGSPRDPFFGGSTIGNPGGAGGSGGTVSINFQNGAVVANGDESVGLQAWSQGGNGGDGGAMSPRTFGNAHAGPAGNGGIGGNLTVDIAQGTFAQQTAGFGSLFAVSLGGVGGNGGVATDGGGASYGGVGGVGASGGSIAMSFGAVTVTETGGTGAAILAQSVGGAGGSGGEGHSTTADGNGGFGGAGGNGGAITINSGTALPGTLTINTNQSYQHGLQANSIAAAGGDGGYGRAVAFKGTGGDGGVGGTGGDIAIDLAGAGITTSGFQALGIYARSYGGAGGSGGPGTGDSGHGGAGSGSGPGGTVGVAFSGAIKTSGVEANAIFAQSVGGFSGNGGTASGFVAYGAGDQSAGDGGQVNVTVAGAQSTIATAALWAAGLTAQSVGGGGGKGSTAGGVVALGGTGSAGGNGGTVTLSNMASVSTGGQGSEAIYAGSHGGGGGAGGGAGGIVSIGGRSGSGGNGGQVTVTNGAPAASGSLQTTGDGSDGIYATSVGGGGGSAHSTAGIVAIGGAGGGGGTGGVVAVQNNGTINTQGQDADGVLAQSVGGGGGAGSNALAVSGGFSLAIGGTGGGGGGGNAASYTDAGAGGYEINVKGDRARGIVVQSLGGGGGDGGNAISASGSPAFDIAIGASGSAGPGGGAGSASASTTAAVVGTGGGNAAAIFVQSVGGGGGNAGTTVSAAEGAVLSANVAVGGSGGAGGNGGPASGSASGRLATAGDVAPGLVVQSVGGGGGHAGTTVAGSGVSSVALNATVGGSGGNGGAAATVSATSTGQIVTSGNASTGIEALSVGGGGGAAHFAGTFNTAAGVSIGATVGGGGGAGGNASAVSVTAAGSIATAGHNAPGISAQSVGGGGGSGSTTITASAVSGADIGVTVGGHGGAGGTGDSVIVNNSADISTVGNISSGIEALSVSKGGGNSGTVVTASGLALGDVGVTVGGSGGAGGSSGAVTVSSQGDITAQGTFSSAIDAKSVAGGGGNARGSITTSGVSMGSITATVGGSGGAGGSAGKVSVTSNGALATSGALAPGIVAQSQGGAGGAGGFAVEAGFNVGEVTGSVNFNFGGGAGGGGTGGAVNVNSMGSIKTQDLGSMGVLAQSIGGNGGTGGAVYSGNLSASSQGSIQLTGNYGGDGGNGSVAGAVTVNNSANITTQSFFATGIAAESIGGNGGNGGTVYTVTGAVTPGSSFGFTASLGGSGGAGNQAGAVSVTNTGQITTAQGGAAGIDAASIGGGGGHGGNAAAINVDLAGAGAGKALVGNVNIGVGGSGGSGGDATTVTIENGGAIATSGIASSAIVAQSIGGGGGSGGTASSFSYSFSGICKLVTGGGSFLCKPSDGSGENTTVKFSLAVEVGGSGGAAGNGGSVMVDNTAAITTTGDNSHAIYAKSIGGGGGHGGEGSTGITAWTTNAIADNLTSYGKLFTSLPSFTNISVAVGGSGGASGTGGDLKITNSSTISTSGAHAFGIHAQSVGGGGGDGGTGTAGFWGLLAVGGRGSGGGTGGSVTVSSPGSIKTAGDGGVAILAHSVGGGGGTAGNVEFAFYQPWINLNLGVGVGVQQAAGNGGDGGAISVTTGAITTSGTAAHGIIAQSVGGSGGIAGISGAASGGVLSYAGSIGDPGSGGTVNVTVGGAVAVSGEGAHGIVAQSVSGKGNGNTSGDVTIDVNASVVASGASGRAILAQSQGFASSGNVDITVAKGVTVATGLQGAETVGIKNGTTNTITNNGALTQGNDASYVIRADGGGSTSVVNYGTISGSVLGTSTALAANPGGPGSPSTISGITIDNRAGGAIDARSLLDVADLRNQGTLFVGGAGRVGNTRLTGNLTQEAGGVLNIDLDTRAANGAGLADRLAIDGAASLNGRIVVNMLSGLQPAAGSHTVSIVTAGKGVSTAGLEGPRSVVAQYGLDQPVPGALNLTYDIDFANAGVRAATNDNQDALARHLHDIFRAQALDTGIAQRLIAIEDGASYARAMNSFSAEVAVDNQIVSLLSASAFNDALLGCTERTGDYRYFHQGNCGWAAIGGDYFKQRATSDNLGFTNSAGQIAGGGQVDVGNGWYVGGAASYDHRSLDVDASTARSSGDTFQGGIHALHRFGATEVSGSLTIGYGSFDNRRTLWDDSAAFAGTQRMWLYGGKVRAAYLIAAGSWAIKPRIDMGVEYLSMDSYDESGNGSLRLQVAGQSNTYVNVQPAVDFVTEFSTADGMQIRPKISLGVTQFLGSATPSVESRLAGAPGDVAPFTTSTALDKTRVTAGASVDVFARKDLWLRIDVFGGFSEHSSSYGAALKVATSF